MERFARQNSDRLTVVGLGTQDSLEETKAFVSDYGTRSFQMLWDPSGESWAQLGISGQPAALLLDERGRELKRWFGPFDQQEALRLASA